MNAAKSKPTPETRPEAAINLGRITRNQLADEREDVRLQLRLNGQRQAQLRNEEDNLRAEHVRLHQAIQEWDAALAQAGVYEKERGR